MCDERVCVVGAGADHRRTRHVFEERFRLRHVIHLAAGCDVADELASR